MCLALGLAMRRRCGENCNERQSGNQEGGKATKRFIAHFRATRGRWHTGLGGSLTAGIIHQKCLLGANSGALAAKCLKKIQDAPSEDLDPLILLCTPMTTVSLFLQWFTFWNCPVIFQLTENDSLRARSAWPVEKSPEYCRSKRLFRQPMNRFARNQSWNFVKILIYAGKLQIEIVGL